MEGSHFPPGQGTFRKIGVQFWRKVDVAGYTPPFFGHGRVKVGVDQSAVSVSRCKSVGTLLCRVLTRVVVVVVVSHIQRIGCQPEKTTLHGGQSRSWSAEQGKENKRKSLAAYPPPHPPHCSFGENK